VHQDEGGRDEGGQVASVQLARSTPREGYQVNGDSQRQYCSAGTIRASEVSKVAAQAEAATPVAAHRLPVARWSP
jgi:hypothetical protein